MVERSAGAAVAPGFVLLCGWHARLANNHRLQEHTLATLDPGELMLQRAYHWEKARANEVFLTQPMGGGVVRDFSWAQTMDEARRVAVWLRAGSPDHAWPS
jgi:hypothetical protein